jgi:SAM-dependent methyltransferase
MENKTRLFDESNAYYKEKITEFGSSVKGLNWKDESAQLVRFEQLAKIVAGNAPFTLNDVGCGFGDFYSFLADRNLPCTEYNGYDISKEVIDIATDRFAGRDNCNFYLVKSDDPIRECDYTIASGIFNLRFSTSEHDWLYYILSNMTSMFAKSRKGCAFNFLTKYSDKEYMRQDLYYADPCFIFDYCKRVFSRNVALLHDYTLYDFTILIRK